MPRTSALAILARILLVPYAIALAMIVWLPDAQAGRVTGIVGRIARALASRSDLSYTFIYTAMEFLANVALFVPFGILLAVGWRRLKTWHLALLGLLTSGVIEFVQLYLPTRFSTVSDLVANTAGAVIGCLVVKVIVWLASVPASPPPGARQGFASTGR